MKKQMPVEAVYVKGGTVTVARGYGQNTTHECTNGLESNDDYVDPDNSYMIMKRMEEEREERNRAPKADKMPTDDNSPVEEDLPF
jgi:hypothetical protein